VNGMCVDDESSIPIHMDLAKAMYNEHVTMMQLDRHQCESIWMLEEQVRHYWMHLAGAALNRLNEMTP
jgi:hypothetical protein